MNAYASAFYVRLSTFSALVGTMQSSPYVRNTYTCASALSKKHEHLYALAFSESDTEMPPSDGHLK